VEKRSFRDIPVVIVRPKEFSPGTRLVVLYHGFGPPQSPQALAEALADEADHAAALEAYEVN
jgi:hypothetical protein